MKVTKIIHKKLVRDFIPEIIERNGGKAFWHTAKEQDMLALLVKKLQEEVSEFVQSGDVEELVDIIEVLKTIYQYKGIREEMLEDLRCKKQKKKGSFTKKVFLEYVEEYI